MSLRIDLFIFLFIVTINNYLGAQENNPPDSSAVKSVMDSTAMQSPPDSLALNARQDSLLLQPKIKKNIIQNVSWEITQKELHRLAIQDMTDVTQLMPSVSAFNLGNPGQVNPFIFRGGKPQQSRALINGMLVEDVISGILNTTVLPFHVADSPGYQTGNSGLSGEAGDALFLKTIEVTGRRPYSNVRYMTGDWTYSDLNAVFGLPVSPTSNLLLSGGRQKYGGFSGQDREVGNSRLFAMLHHQLKKNLGLNFTGLLNKNEAVIPGFYPPDFIQDVQLPRKEENRLDSRLALHYENNNASYGLDGGVRISRVHQESFDNTTMLFDNQSAVTAFTLQNIFRTDRLEYRLGAEFKLIDINSGQIKDLQENIYRSYAGANFDLSAKLNIDFLAAIEKHRAYKAELNPGLMINYKISDNSGFWSSAKKYVRYPTFAERFWPLPLYSGNASLSPEQIRSFDFGYKTRLKTNIDLQSAVFYKSIHNWIENGFDNAGLSFTFRNIENYNILGLDLKSNWQYYNAGNLGITASFLNFNASEPIVPNSPEFVLHTYIEAGRSLFQNYVFPVFRLSSRFYSVRTGWLYSGISNPRVVELPSVMIFDAQLKLIFESAIVTLAYKNLFNEVYELVPGFLIQPRTLILGIDWEFWD